MRLAALPAIALCMAIAAAASAQEPSPHAGTPEGVADLPAGPGTLQVRLEHPERPEAAAGLTVVVYALREDAPPGLRGATSDAHGEVVFEGVSNDPLTRYLVGVSYAGVHFGAPVRFAPGEDRQSLVLPISEPSSDPAQVSLGEVELRLEGACSGIQVIESWEARNASQQVIHVPEEARASSEPLFETELPEGAVGFAAGPGVLGLELDGQRLRFWGPLHPGSRRLEIGYGLPVAAQGTTLRRGFPSGAARLTVAAPAEGPRVEPDGVLAEPVPAGASFEIAVGPLPTRTDSEGLTLHRAQMWLELDDAALRADERYELEARDPQTLGPLCLQLPDGAQDLRFSSASLALGLSRDPGGDLVVRGPFPSQRWILSLRYLLPAAPGETRWTRSLPLELPLLSVYLADTGVRAESERLHRRRPVLSEDRSYMHFEGFGLTPDEELALTLRPVPVSRRASGVAVATFMGVAALASLLFLAAPLRGRPGAPHEAPAPAASMESEAIDAALRDLEHDFETGKLASEDYESFGRELRARAKELRGQEREPPAAPAAPPSCAECGASFAPTARFCAQCGARRQAGNDAA